MPLPNMVIVQHAQAGERVVMDPSLAAYVRTILPRNVAKYWLQRYSLFTKYDDGIQVRGGKRGSSTRERGGEGAAHGLRP